MVLSLHTLYLTAGGVELDVVDGQITLDERRSPYVQGRFSVVTPSNQDALDALNAKTGEVRGFARIEYRDAVLPSEITAWVGTPVTAAKVTAAMNGRTCAAVTALFSSWGNPDVTVNGKERDSEMLPFRLVVTAARPDPETELTEITVTSLETRVIDYRRLTDGALIDAGKLVAELVQETLTRVSSAYSLVPVDDRYETVPDWFTLSEQVQWKAGVGAWDFLDPILQTAGVTLQCTPDGQWRLVRANADYFAAVNVDATAVDISESREDWGDAVIIIYRWRDAGGTDRVRTDYAQLTSTPQKTLSIEYRDVPYPGPGAATVVLARAQKLAREITVQSVEGFVDRFGAITRPGVGIATSANGEATNGRITAVTFEWPANTMTITARS